MLEVLHGEHRYVIKAAGPANHHIRREIEAHQACTAVWSSRGLAPRLVAADRSLNLLVTEYLDGCLVEGDAAEYREDTYLQAGQLLRLFHAQATRVDARYEVEATAKAAAWLQGLHRIDPAMAKEAEAVFDAYRPEPVVLVPTHGDWQPRNWLVNGSRLRIIDFGRFAFRPALSDFCRLAAQQWRAAPGLEAAFFAGYGADPRESTLWDMALLREAVATAVWAHQVDDHRFEHQGHRMIRDALAAF
ncbi:MAG: phosphotransferase [Actinomycetes bacterium]